MAYSDFTLKKVKKDLDLILDESHNLFADTKPVSPSIALTNLLTDYIPLAISISTEKARSEFLIAPVLAEVKKLFKNKVSLFSGNEFNVEPARGLEGFCDYIISGSPEQLLITAPVIILVEAKKEDIIGGLGQCIAAMFASQLFNCSEGNEIIRIYGCVTSGTNWKFLFLEGNTVYIDQIEYYIKQVDVILGILLQTFSSILAVA